MRPEPMFLHFTKILFSQCNMVLSKKPWPFQLAFHLTLTYSTLPPPSHPPEVNKCKHENKLFYSLLHCIVRPDDAMLLVIKKICHCLLIRLILPQLTDAIFC